MFPDHLKKIYRSPSTKFSALYDPLRVDNDLTVATGNKLAALVTMIRSASEGTGDISSQGKDEAQVERARAERELANAARTAFALPEFPKCLDAEALEILYDFLEYLEKKGLRDEPSPGSHDGFPESSDAEMTTTSGTWG